jgi:hypothetical protein
MSFQPTGRAAHPSSRQVAVVVHARLREPDHCGDWLNGAKFEVGGLDVPTTGMPQQQERPDKPTNLDFQN